MESDVIEHASKEPDIGGEGLVECVKAMTITYFGRNSFTVFYDFHSDGRVVRSDTLGNTSSVS